MPGSFIGFRVSLTQGEFAHAFAEPGTYRIRAHLRLDQTTWVTERMRAIDPDRTELFYDVGRVYNGVLESNEVTIRIVPP
jgi:hypothetical protein